MLPDVVVIDRGGGGPSVVEQILLVFGVIGPLLGVWLGHRWARRSADEGWLRNRRVDAYSRFNVAITQLDDKVTGACLEQTKAERLQKIREVFPGLTAVRHTSAEIDLLGPDAMRRPTFDAELACEALYVETTKACGRTPDGGGAPIPSRDASFAARNAFLAAAKSEVRRTTPLGPVARLRRRLTAGDPGGG